MMDHRSKFYNKLLRMDMSQKQFDESYSEDEKLKSGIRDYYIVAVDIGTTTLRSHVYIKDGTIKGTSSKRIEMLYPKPGWFEMDPDLLVQKVIDCIKESVRAAGITMKQVTCIGISTQRATFLTWDRETGKPFHNFITWQDVRSKDYVKLWNDSYKLKALNKGSAFLHVFTRSKRFLAASVLKFMTQQVSMRLLWALENIQELKDRLYKDQVMFGCIDTWLLWKLTGEKVFATDYSSASATGLFDPFQVEWSAIVCGLLNIPMTIFPEIKDSSGLFGKTDTSIFGTALPITCMIADQMAAMFGECCFDVGDVKVTMGTGTFIDVNTGSDPHASVAGLYPQVGWKLKGERLVYVAEGCITDTGILMEWAKSIGLCDDVSDTSRLAQSVTDSDGVSFVPCFSGLQAPINDPFAATSIIGLKPTTKKAHIIRALLESLAFRFKILYETILTETSHRLSDIRADGGVCNNDFLMQLIADFTDQHLDIPAQRANMTSLGTTFLAGLEAGVWKSKDELCKIRKSEKVIVPQRDTWPKYTQVFTDWERAVTRSKGWYSNSS